MEKRFNLSFKNKEVRMWFYLMLPFAIAGFIFIFLFDSSASYYSYIHFFPTASWAIYFIWFYFYRKNKRKSSNA